MFAVTTGSRYPETTTTKLTVIVSSSTTTTIWPDPNFLYSYESAEVIPGSAAKNRGIAAAMREVQHKKELKKNILGPKQSRWS